MPTLQLVDAHRAELADISALAVADLVGEWSAMPLDDAVATKRLATGLATDLVDYYGTLSAGAGADWYSELRAEAKVRGAFSARLVVPIIPEQIASNVGWAVVPLFGDADPAKSLARLSGTLQRLVANADRETVLTNAKRDKAEPRWYRHPSPGACAFCAMLAGRGNYRSEASAMRSHDNCKCVAVPIFERQWTPPDHILAMSGEYDAAREDVLADGMKPDASAILARMRVLTGRA